MWNSRHFACSLLMASGTLGWGGRAGVSELAAQGINQNNAGGIRIDAEGIVRLAVENDSSGTLDRQRREAASKQRLPADMAQPASQRLVSLVRIEQQIEDCLKESQSIPDEIFFLAGLQRIDHIFVFPEDRDLVIAGPADGFSADATGRMIGVESRRPVLRLDDLSVALRTIPVASQIGCSIDPVPERLAALQNFIRTGKPANAAAVEARFQKMDELGITQRGVDENGITYRPAAVVDGHISRMGEEFLRYVNDTDSCWEVNLGASYGTELWQLHDDNDESEEESDD